MATILRYPVTMNGLTYYYDVMNPKCYTGTGSTINDMFGKNTATLYGSPVYSNTTVPPNINFASQYMVCGAINDLRAISMFVRISPVGGWEYLVDLRSGGLDNSWFTGAGIGALWTVQYVNGVNTGVGWGYIPTNQWAHLYIELNANYNISAGHFFSRMSNNEFLAGKMNAIQFYNRQLTAAEIQQNYKLLKARANL